MKFQRKRYACLNCQRYKTRCTPTFPCKRCMWTNADCIKEAHSLPKPLPPVDPWLEFCSQRSQAIVLPPFHVLQARLLLESINMNSQHA